MSLPPTSLNGNTPPPNDTPSSDSSLSDSSLIPPPSSLKSGGPKSLAGKSSSRMNGFRHGLEATDEIFLARLGSRERSAYRKIRRSLHKFYDPETSLEKLIVDRMAIQHLRMLRLYEIEAVAVDDTALNKKGPYLVIPHLDRLARYDVRIERQLRILHNRLIFMYEWRKNKCINLFPTKE